MEPLTQEQIAEHHSVLRIACDPNSPFYGMVDFGEEGGLLSLPIPQQHQIYNAMPPDLRAMVEATKAK
jgi:hypothetical protein